MYILSIIYLGTYKINNFNIILYFINKLIKYAIVNGKIKNKVINII